MRSISSLRPTPPARAEPPCQRNKTRAFAVSDCGGANWVRKRICTFRVLQRFAEGSAGNAAPNPCARRYIENMPAEVEAFSPIYRVPPLGARKTFSRIMPPTWVC